ncbi:MAG TPA: HRDC domain-containing protein, partial [Anaerolineae bacterium]|nr:HRDC domain-containing protein [Anaerolineae bacterium]
MARLTQSDLITTQPALQEMLRRLGGRACVAIDTESNSMHAYTERVCLVQVSMPGADYLIDPLSKSIELRALGPLFAGEGVEKVFHACEYDVISLRRDYGFAFANVFDTMWAARILGWPRVGLADILKERFGVTMDKRWQRFNWGQRPLPADALAYARLDTRYLVRLRDLQMRELRRTGRLEEAREVFAGLAVSEAAPRDELADGDGFWRVKGVYDLEPAARAVLRELYLYRDGAARRADRPPFKIIGDNTLIEIARACPAQLDQLRRVPGMSEGQLARHGLNLLRAVARGQKASPPRAPARKSIDPTVLTRYERLREWRKQAAGRRGVDPDVIVSNAALMALARRRARSESDLEGIDGLGPWRRR